ncbi:GNAT family N-acetyltransferase [Micromonospora sp. NPDC048999]|uniref:GNAT family N-acetyltransferase n=1 Tax=Micromonospora sp. NPDC048999 TaxID=3155391 RepID=UPI003402C74B
MRDRGFGNDELMTPRLSLRRPTPADIDLIHAIHSDPRACAHNPADMLGTRADAEDLYRRWDEHWQRYGFGYWVIYSGGSGVGFCGIKLMRLTNRDVLNLFYRLDSEAWGKGIATEAASAVVDSAADQLPGYPVIARVRPANVASQRVAVRAGLHRAEHLDTQGEDGLDWIYTTHWP